MTATTSLSSPVVGISHPSPSWFKTLMAQVLIILSFIVGLEIVGTGSFSTTGGSRKHTIFQKEEEWTSSSSTTTRRTATTSSSDSKRALGIMGSADEPTTHARRTKRNTQGHIGSPPPTEPTLLSAPQEAGEDAADDGIQHGSPGTTKNILLSIREGETSVQKKKKERRKGNLYTEQHPWHHPASSIFPDKKTSLHLADPSCPRSSTINRRKLPMRDINTNQASSTAVNKRGGSSSSFLPAPRFEAVATSHPVLVLLFVPSTFTRHSTCLGIATALQYGYKVRLVGYDGGGGGGSNPDKRTGKKKRFTPSGRPTSAFLSETLSKELVTVDHDTLVVIADASDVIFTQTPGQFLLNVKRSVERHREMKFPDSLLPNAESPTGRLVVAATTELRESSESAGSSSVQRARAQDQWFEERNAILEDQMKFSPFPSSAVFIGFREGLRRTLEDIYKRDHYHEHKIRPEWPNADQLILTRLWKHLELKHRLIIDQRSDIVQNMVTSKEEFSFLNPGMFPPTTHPAVSNGVVIGGGGEHDENDDGNGQPFPSTPKNCSSPTEWCFEPMPVSRKNYLTGSFPGILFWGNEGGGGATTTATRRRIPEYIRCGHFTPWVPAVSAADLDETKSSAPSDREKEMKKKRANLENDEYHDEADRGTNQSGAAPARDWLYSGIRHENLEVRDVAADAAAAGSMLSSYSLDDVCPRNLRELLCDNENCT